MQNVWLVRAGEEGYLIDEFVKGYVGVGFNRMGDMASIKSQDGMYELYVKSYPDVKEGKIGNAVAMAFKFRSVMQVDDKLLTYDSHRREYLVGTIISDYSYSPNVIKDYPNIRKVKWEGRVSRDSLSVSSRNSLGCISTLFSVNEDVWKEIQNVMEGKVTINKEEKIIEEKDESEQIREDTVARAHELIKDKILSLDDAEMERLVAAILRALGYRTRVSPKGPDRGVDIFASPDGLGLEEPRIKVEVKHRSNQMGSKEIRSFIAVLLERDKALYISTGEFSKEAKYEADRSKSPLTLLDLDDLARLIVSHYENFDTEGKALIPLVRVYWPAD